MVFFHHFLLFLTLKSMPFIGQKHAFYRVKAMLLSDKSNAFTSRKHAVCCLFLRKQLEIRSLRKRSILAFFRIKFGLAGYEGLNEPGFFSFRSGFKL